MAPTSVAVSETDAPRRRTIRGDRALQQLRSRRAERRSGAAAAAIRGVGRGSSCDPGERSGGRARQESMAARRDTRPRHAPAPEGYGTLPPPKAAAPAPPKAAVPAPTPMAGDIPRAASPPTADGARRRDIKRILAAFPRCERFVRQFAADNDPQTPFSPDFFA